MGRAEWLAKGEEREARLRAKSEALKVKAEEDKAQRAEAKAKRKAENAERKAELDEKKAELTSRLAERKELADSDGSSLGARLDRAAEHRRYNARFEDYAIEDGKFRISKRIFSERIPIGGATAVFESGADRKRMTGTRIVTGRVLFGPAGAVVGGLLKKNKTKCYITITLADGAVVIVETSIKNERKAREFAGKINTAGAHYAA